MSEDYPHCRHCAWSHPEHTDTHHTPCGASWCDVGSTPITQDALFEATA